MPSDVYIRFDGLEGDSKDHLNEKWIEVDSVGFQFGMATTDERSASGAATTGRVTATDVVFTKTMDTASLPLFQTLWRGTHVSKVEIKLYRAHQEERICYMRVELSDVVISSASLSGVNGVGLPGESYTLNYGSILVEYTPTSKTAGGAQPKPIRVSLNTITHQIS